MAEAAEISPDIPEAILNCPICFERYKKPKTLPCVHTFCEECLSTYIMKFNNKNEEKASTGFTCPICRAIAVPVDITTERSTWAKQFPTNSFIVDILEIFPFQSKEKICDACRRQGKNQHFAKVWCKNCKSCLCDPCKSVHNALGLVHDVISIEEATQNPENVMEQYWICSQHKEKLDLFCVDHENVACAKCIAIDHRKCETVTTADDYAQKLRGSEDLDKMLKTYKRYNGIVIAFKTKIQKERERRKLQRDEIQHTVSDALNNARKHLKDVEISFRQQLTDLCKSEERELTSKEEECAIIQATVEQSRKMLKASVKLGGTTQFLSQVVKSKSESTDFTQKIQGMQFESKTLSTEINKTLLNFKGLVSKVATLKETEDTVVCPSYLRDDRQMTEKSPKLIKKINVRLKSDLGENRITGILYLNEDRLIVCDSANGKVKLFSTTGDILSEYVLKDARDVCRLDEATIAVTFSSDRIHVLRLNNEKIELISKLSCSKSSYGIELFKGNILVTIAYPHKEIQLIDRNGTSLRTVSMDDSGTKLFQTSEYPDHIAASGRFSRIVVTQSSSSTPTNRYHAIIFNSDLKILSKVYNDCISQARDVDFDEEGNIYICGRQTHNLVQMSCNGENPRIILSSLDGIQVPIAISFNKEKFLLSEDAEGDSNIVKLYQMI